MFTGLADVSVTVELVQRYRVVRGTLGKSSGSSQLYDDGLNLEDICIIKAFQLAGVGLQDCGAERSEIRHQYIS